MASKRRKKIGKKIGGVLAVGAPLLGTTFFGPLGGLVGTAVGTGASAALTPGDRKKKLKVAKRSALIGGGITLGGMALGSMSGAGMSAPLTSSLGSLFGGGGSGATGEDPDTGETENVNSAGQTTKSGLFGTFDPARIFKSTGAAPGSIPGNDQASQEGDAPMQRAGMGGGILIPAAIGIALLFLLKKKAA